jgi:hypothetical protein
MFVDRTGAGCPGFFIVEILEDSFANDYNDREGSLT